MKMLNIFAFFNEGDFEIENSADSKGSLVASVDGVDLVISPGEAAETNAQGALGLLRQDVPAGSGNDSAGRDWRQCPPRQRRGLL